MSKSKASLNRSFLDNYEDVSPEVAMELIVEAEQRIKEIQKQREADQRLAEAKQVVKDINSAYNDAIKYERAKISFFLEKLEQAEQGTTKVVSS